MNISFFFSFLFFCFLSEFFPTNDTTITLVMNVIKLQIPIHIILIIIQYHSHLTRITLNFEFSFKYTIFKYNRQVFDCREDTWLFQEHTKSIVEKLLFKMNIMWFKYEIIIMLFTILMKLHNYLQQDRRGGNHYS